MSHEAWSLLGFTTNECDQPNLHVGVRRCLDRRPEVAPARRVSPIPSMRIRQHFVVRRWVIKQCLYASLRTSTRLPGRMCDVY